VVHFLLSSGKETESRDEAEGKKKKEWEKVGENRLSFFSYLTFRLREGRKGDQKGDRKRGKGRGGDLEELMSYLIPP